MRELPSMTTARGLGDTTMRRRKWINLLPYSGSRNCGSQFSMAIARDNCNSRKLARPQSKVLRSRRRHMRSEVPGVCLSRIAMCHLKLEVDEGLTRVGRQHKGRRQDGGVTKPQDGRRQPWAYFSPKPRLPQAVLKRDQDHRDQQAAFG